MAMIDLPVVFFQTEAIEDDDPLMIKLMGTTDFVLVECNDKNGGSI